MTTGHHPRRAVVVLLTIGVTFVATWTPVSAGPALPDSIVSSTRIPLRGWCGGVVSVTVDG